MPVLEHTHISSGTKCPRAAQGPWQRWGKAGLLVTPNPPCPELSWLWPLPGPRAEKHSQAWLLALVELEGLGEVLLWGSLEADLRGASTEGSSEQKSSEVPRGRPQGPPSLGKGRSPVATPLPRASLPQPAQRLADWPSLLSRTSLGFECWCHQTK